MTSLLQAACNDVRAAASYAKEPMPMTTFESILDTQLAELKSTLMRKRHDYGPGNLSRHGEFGILVRISDKFERLNTLIVANETPNFESIDDTWTDIAGYSVLALIMKSVGPDAFAQLPLSKDGKE